MKVGLYLMYASVYEALRTYWPWLLLGVLAVILIVIGTRRWTLLVHLMLYGVGVALGVVFLFLVLEYGPLFGNQ